MKIRLSNFLKYLGFPFLILILGGITYFTYTIEISADLSFYMNAALNIFQGKGYVDIDLAFIDFRGPVFSYFIAFAYWLLGVSVESAFWVVRIFCILNPLLLYYVGKRFYGKWVGFLAALFILSSYSINYWSYRHIDAIIPFFIILAVFLTFIAFEGRRLILFIFPGITVAVAYLVKEIALLYFILPFVMIIFIKEYRNRKNIYGSFIFLFALVSVLALWIFYAFNVSGELTLFGGTFDLSSEKEILFSSSNVKSAIFGFLTVVKNYIRGLYLFYEHSVRPNFPIPFIFVFAWIFTLISAARGNKIDKILVVSFLLFSPVMSFVGINNFRVGQGILIFLLSYLVTANFIVHSCNYVFGYIALIFNSNSLRKAIPVTGLFIFVGLFIYVHWMVGEVKNIDFLENSLVFNKRVGKKMELNGKYFLSKRDVSTYILENIPAGTKLMCDWPWTARGIYFYTKGDYPIYNMPIISVFRFSGAGKVLQLHKGLSFSRLPIHKKNEKILFISSWNDKLDPRNRFSILTEADLLREIRDKSVKFLLISERRNFLTKYFDSNPGFLNKAEFNFNEGWIKIYEVERLMPSDKVITLVCHSVSQFLNNMKTHNKGEYRWFQQEFFQNSLGWGVDRLKMIEERSYDEDFEEVRIYFKY